MHFLTSTLLLGALLVPTTTGSSSPVLERQDQDGWNFSIFQDPDCSPALGGASKHSGDCASAQACLPGLEWLFTSTQVYSDAAGHCNVTFYRATGTGTGGTCSLPVASYPGDIQLNTCFNFATDTRPVTFGVVCED